MVCYKLDEAMRSKTPVTVDLLGELELFAGLSQDQLASLAAAAELVEVAEGEKLIEQGGPAEKLQIVVSGKFRLCLELAGEREHCLLTMTQGEIIGWSALLAQPTWLASATAIKPSSALSIDGSELRKLCDQDHHLGYVLMSNLFSAVAARLQDTRLQLIDMYKDA